VLLAGAVTAPPRPSGRRAALTATPIHQLADALGLPVLTPARLRDPASVADVLALEPSLAVLADYGQLVPGPILDLPHGALNLHPSLLPRYRGASPIPAAIAAGDRETGVTLMRMDPGLDTGPIVAVGRVDLHGDEAAPDLEARLADVAAALLAESLGPWREGRLRAAPQPSEGASLTRPLRREDGRLDPDEPAAVLERRVRAHLPWPGSWLETADGRLAIRRAHVGGAERSGHAAPGHAAPGHAAPGTLLHDGLVTAEGLLVPDEVQPAGGRLMTWDAYLRGRPELVGSRALRRAAPLLSEGSARPSSA
jgi:methionyl-tRNA formyltransferase